VVKEDGVAVGGICRALDQSPVKVYNTKGSKPVPFICGNSRVAILVEDCASAARLGDRYTGIALLGTHLKKEYLPYILHYDRIIICLDKDASQKAVKLRNYLVNYKDTNVVFLQKDIKDMTADEYNQFLDKLQGVLT
jgi:hypothetical protein